MKNIIPVILLKELVILPNQEIKIELYNKISKRIIKNAIDSNGKVLVVAPLDKNEEDPSVDDLPKVGVVAKVKNRIQLSSGNIRVTLRGINRVIVKKYATSELDDNILISEVENADLPKYDEVEEKAVRRKLIDILKEYINSSDNISNSILTTVNSSKDLNKVTDIITSFLPFNTAKKLEYMQNINPINRAKRLINDINEEIRLNRLDDEIDDIINEKLAEENRKFILKEKVNVIKSELGEISIHEQTANEFKEKVEKLNINSASKEKILQEINKFAILNDNSPEIGVYHSYLDWIINLPWNKYSKDTTNIQKVRSILDQSHYGLDDIKQRIIEYVQIKKNNSTINSPIICLVGPPGVGKTSIAMSIANALNKKFYKISVGGLNDSAELTGHRKTYLGANPGKIIQGLRKCKVKNPLFLIDEVDKMLRDNKGDPASTLLEILDPTQNKYFTDNYIEEPFDISKIFFILTANTINDIPETILDRVEVINLNSYTIFEKKDIAVKYILPRVYDEFKIKPVKFTDDVLYYVIKHYTNEAGVRDLERVLSALTRKIIINDINKLTVKKVNELLGKPKYVDEQITLDKTGIVNNLAVSSYGGIISKMESVKFKGNGKITITGSVGEVMKETIDVALSYLRSEYDINASNMDIHLHFPAIHVKKDGPSAGVGIATSILSLIEKKKIPQDIAFTGELSLNGQILRIGGLKEKLIAAYNNDINVVYIPSSNSQDLEDIPKYILDKLEIRCVNDYKQIYTKIFK